MKYLRSFVALVPALSFVLSCSHTNKGTAVLQGHVSGDPAEVIVLSYLPGQSIGYHYPEVSDGKFEFFLDDVEAFADLTVSVGGVEFGARVNANDTLKMNFTVNKYGDDVSVEYDGATEKESRIWTDFYETYCHFGNYDLTPDRDPALPYEESLALLERNDSSFRAKYGADLDSYYLRRSELAHDLLKSIFLESISYRDGADPIDSPDYLEMVRRVDPNDPDQVVFPMVIRWMSFKLRDFEGDDIERYTAFLQEYAGRLKNPDVKHLLANVIVGNCMMDINAETPEVYEPLFAAIEGFDPAGAETVARYRARIDAVLSSAAGKLVPEAFLLAPDGREVRLSSLFGKLLYIDVWATWCGPCLREGPYFRALAQKYKDDPRISFISISADLESAPWLEFLDEEKPFWPQYRFDESAEEDFCDKVGIQTIPRFILIDAEGRFIDADCIRPSNEDIEKVLSKALNSQP